MPAFCARWPDGSFSTSFSIVDADDETHALIQLDELGDEPAQLWRMQSCLLDFELTDGGAFRIKQFGEATGPEIMERAYPVLSKALKDERFAGHAIEQQTEPIEYEPSAKKLLCEAVDAERKRMKDFQKTSATTEHGKAIQQELGASGVYIDAIVEQSASKRLKKYKPPKHVKPS
jgi:hypothetical protein